jgi:SPP1 gp7 family putative phage head morphogenesis protein
MFLTKPVPFQEASDAIAGLAPVDRDTFANLIPELKDAALTIAGVEGLEVVTRVRDLISQLPLGGDFEELKAQIEEELSPWLTEKGAAKRATLLLRLHGFRAYAAAGYRQMEAHKDAFPYRQYVATMDEATRHSHRALHGVVLPSNHPFWLNHTGPWAWGCRCEAVPLTAGAMERIQKADESRDPDKALVITGPLRQKLEAGELVRGPTMIFDVRTERERTGDPNAFEWQPGYAGMTLEEIGKRYTPLEMQHFERWASGVETGDGRNLWEVLSKGRGAVPVVPVKKPPVIPPVKQALKVTPDQWQQILKENEANAEAARTEQVEAAYANAVYQHKEADS